MHRSTVDNSMVYTPEDFALFQASPFASWMERFDIEVPDHGVSTSEETAVSVSPICRQDHLAKALSAKGRHVELVDWELSRSARRARTLQAMADGADFIINAQLSAGPLTSAVNMLMRTPGQSQWGNYLYIPCDAQGESRFDTALRLCFQADLLEHVQGQLPAQMLLIMSENSVAPLNTEDHIYSYRAVKSRFMSAQRDFTPVDMPDPALSAHFGRWAAYANQILKHRADTLGTTAQSALLADDKVAASAKPQFDSTQAPAANLAYRMEDQQISATLSEALDRQKAALARRELDENWLQEKRIAASDNPGRRAVDLRIQQVQQASEPDSSVMSAPEAEPDQPGFSDSLITSRTVGAMAANKRRSQDQAPEH